VPSRDLQFVMKERSASSCKLTRRVVLSIHYLALKSLSSATTDILNEGEQSLGESVQHAKGSICNKVNELGSQVQQT